MAYNTRAKLQQEGAWTYTIWQPVSASSGDFDTLTDNIITRCAKNVEWRIGTSAYSGASALLQVILEEAELCLGMYYLCMAVAAIADSSDNSEQNPPIAQGRFIRYTAQDYKKRYDELLSPYDTKLARSRWRRPASTTSTNNLPEFIPNPEQEIDWGVEQ